MFCVTVPRLKNVVRLCHKETLYISFFLQFNANEKLTAIAFPKQTAPPTFSCCAAKVFMYGFLVLFASDVYDQKCFIVLDFHSLRFRKYCESIFI